MGDVGACWDNAVVERFFVSLKHDWLFKTPQLTRGHMKSDVIEYMRKKASYGKQGHVAN